MRSPWQHRDNQYRSAGQKYKFSGQQIKIITKAGNPQFQNPRSHAEAGECISIVLFTTILQQRSQEFVLWIPACSAQNIY